MEAETLVADLMGHLHRDLYFTFKAENQAEDCFRVVKFQVEEGLSTPFTITLLLASANQAIDENDIVDQEGLLTVFRNQISERYFHGVVFSFSKGDTGRHHTFYQMTLVPSFARLSLRSNSRIFQGQSVIEITESLLNEMGITDYALALRHEHQSREYCVQYSESDQTFIERLLAEEGIFYYFEHKADSHTLVFADDNSIVNDLNISCIYNNHSGGVAATHYIRDLQQNIQVKPNHAVLNDYSFKQPSANFQSPSFASGSDYQREYEHYMYPGRFKKNNIGEAFSQTRVAYLRSDSNTITGNSNIGPLNSGYLFTILEHPSISASESWLLTHIKHIGTQPQSLANAGSQGKTDYSNHFSALPATQQWKPQPEIKPRIYGPQIATVVGPSGEEIYTDVFGRVKVQFPWDRYGEKNENSSCWVRVVQDWAGSSYGGVMLPRIGHEVVVSFLEGDPDQPLVTGRTYHATNQHAYSLPGLKALASFKSKEHQSSGYGELLLDDSTGEIKTQLHSTYGASQLTMGYLTHPRSSDGKGEKRGEGFELRTDEWGAIRAGKGLYISSDKREKAQDDQLDISEAIDQLEKALMIAKQLSKGEQEAGIEPYHDINSQEQQLENVYRELKKPGMLLSSPEGIALVSPKDIQLSTENTIKFITTKDTMINAFTDVDIAARKSLTLFAAEKALNMISNQGSVKLQAQHNQIDIDAKKSIKLTSSEEKINLVSAKEIILSAGGSQIKINEQGVTVSTAGEFRVESAQVNMVGPKSIGVNTKGLPDVDLKNYSEQFTLLLPSGEKLTNIPYQIKSGNEQFKAYTNESGQTRSVFTKEEQEIKLDLTWIESFVVDSDNNNGIFDDSITAASEQNRGENYG